MFGAVCNGISVNAAVTHFEATEGHWKMCFLGWHVELSTFTFDGIVNFVNGDVGVVVKDEISLRLAESVIANATIPTIAIAMTLARKSTSSLERRPLHEHKARAEWVPGTLIAATPQRVADAHRRQVGVSVHGLIVVHEEALHAQCSPQRGGGGADQLAVRAARSGAGAPKTQADGEQEHAPQGTRCSAGQRG